MFGLERSKQYILGVVVDRRMAASLTVRGGRQHPPYPRPGLPFLTHLAGGSSLPAFFYGPGQVVKPCTW